ncbi:uncharacterized protein CLAFUR5_11738 [Fulvia fulva]|uniref:non-specific serine/threonine protein kinase n=1 Tax=Passalora fulva TaxID=5499 RepID=A0A9Q8UUI3_PASFU|nr:uncharacterized protein CLAFUR5_11738 [Fulvia fulva]KAK4628221.1 hypothetical protein CLAFUR0_05160 [Fulvia fulva]UJO22827.1 hypothetical protein CLAFUR5_11738 [Fulvia fulva]WPV28137.1 hypothetical protein CLAFUW7_05164 [Fulvia fulva]
MLNARNETEKNTMSGVRTTRQREHTRSGLGNLADALLRPSTTRGLLESTMAPSMPNGKLDDFIQFAVERMIGGQAVKDREISLLTTEYLAQPSAHLAILDETVIAVNDAERHYYHQLQTAEDGSDYIRRNPDRTIVQRANRLDKVHGAALLLVETCHIAFEALGRASRAHQAHLDRTTRSPILIALGRWLTEYNTRLQDAVQSKYEVKDEFDDAVRVCPGRKVPWPMSKLHPQVRDQIQRVAIEEVKKIPAFEPLPSVFDDTIKWAPVHHFQGGMSKATLMVGVDSTTRMIKMRMVRKDTLQSDRQWGNVKFWRGDLRNGHNMLPTEYVSHRLVGGAPGSRFVPKILADVELNPHQLSYHMMMEFAANGDLWDVFDAHRKARIAVPELFLWLVFQALIEAAVVMKRGNSDQDVASRADWMEIVHCDLKPRNVFLDLPHEEHFKLYPRPKLGDFGCAFLTTPKDTVNPLLWCHGGGTRGFLAPEQDAHADGVTGKLVDDFPLISHTNVWGI